MKPTIKLFLMGFVAVLSSCAHSMKERQFDPALCEEGLAYQAGFNDGRDGNNMNAGFTYGCRDDLRAGSLKGYKEGFEKGHSDFLKQQEEQRKLMAQMEHDRFQAEAQVRAQSQPTDPGFIGGGASGGGYGSGGNYLRWFCEIEAFNKKFEGAGNTEFDARRNTKQLCELKQGHESIFCDNAACRSETASNNNRAWLCTIDNFGSKFEGFGPTRTDADRSVHSICRLKLDRFNCDNNSPECQQLR
jgi:hypothetical protein